MQVLIIRNFIDLDTCEKLNAWVDLGVSKKWLDVGLNNTASSWTYKKRVTTRAYAERFKYPAIVYEVFNKITDFLKIQDLQKSTAGGGQDGVVVSCTFPSGSTHKHVDPKEGELEVLRCNILTRAAESGGDLFIENNKINIGVGDLHCYLPSTVEHHVTTVEGNTSRVLWMFGYKCSLNRFNKLVKVRA